MLAGGYHSHLDEVRKVTMSCIANHFCLLLTAEKQWKFMENLKDFKGLFD